MALIRNIIAVSVALSSSACDVTAVAVGTGGVDADHGLIALLSDYSSVQIALLGPDGRSRSDSFLSSGSAPTSGLAFAFSGDTVLPSSPSASGEVVLIDRFGTNVISWANPRTAEVRTQLAVGTGFESNPRDYLELSPQKAYVSRWGENSAPGSEPFDAGGNVLVIDPSVPEISGSIEMPRENGLPPRPSSLTRLGSTAIVVLQRIARDFATTGESRLIGISTDSDQIVWTLPVSGFKGCGKATPSPSGRKLAVACTGDIDPRGRLKNAGETGIVVFDATRSPPLESGRFAQESLGAGLQSELAFASEALIVAKTQTAVGEDAHNQLLSLDLDSGEVRTLSTAAPDARGRGQGIVYGGVYCNPDDLCLLADGDTKTVRRFDVAGDLSELSPTQIGGAGLPPLALGAY